MMRGRSPMKIKPQTESGRAHSLPGIGTGRSGHIRNNSISRMEGDFNARNLQTGSSDVREDQLQITSKRSHALTRSSSTRHDTTKNSDLNKKKPEAHYMKTTRCFNAKSQRPIDLDDSKVKKKMDPDLHGVRRRSEDIRGFRHHKLAEPIYPYLKASSRSSSVDSRSTPTLKRLPSLNSSRVLRQNQEDTAKLASKKKTGTKGETEVRKFTAHHLTYAEEGESVVKEIIKDESSNLHSLETEGTKIEMDTCQTSIKDDIEISEETGYLELSLNHELTSRHDNSEKLEVISENISEIKIEEPYMEDSLNHELTSGHDNSEKLEVISENISEIKIEEPYMEDSQPDCNLEDTAENSSMEKHEVTEEITNEKDDDCMKHEVIDTKYDEIDNLCVLSSSNDETEDLHEISIEEELSKIMSTDNTHCIKTHCIEQEQNVLPIDIVSIIEEIANELEGREKDSAGDEDDDMHPTWRLKKWKVDFVVQRLVQKLESTDKNKVSMLIQAYESVIPLMMRRMATQNQVSSQ